MSAWIAPTAVELVDAWVDGEPALRWRSAAALGPGTGARASGASVLEVDSGHALARHTDSAEEVIVVVGGTAEVVVDNDSSEVAAGGVALVPANAPHEVRNAGDGVLRFVAVYAAAEVITTYEHPVQPDGGQERDPVA
jgi:quercetin dioxygenase-like cupin family protein